MDTAEKVRRRWLSDFVAILGVAMVVAGGRASGLAQLLLFLGGIASMVAAYALGVLSSSPKHPPNHR